MAVSNPLTLTDWRRNIFALYAGIRNCPPNERAGSWEVFRQTRDDLFAQHPQTPLNAHQLNNFSGIEYFEYDPAYAVLGELNFDVEREMLTAELDVDGLFRYTRVATIDFSLIGRLYHLNLYWIEGYGGALYLPFGDLTNGKQTYGGGRYLFDAIKGADLGTFSDQLVLDFNFAYNPSCAYNDSWSCPLTPPENRLPIEILAGEKSIPVY